MPKRLQALAKPTWLTPNACAAAVLVLYIRAARSTAARSSLRTQDFAMCYPFAWVR